MKFTVHNRTEGSVYIWPDDTLEKAAVVDASSSSTITQKHWPLFGRTVTLSRSPDPMAVGESTRISGTALWRPPKKSWSLESKSDGQTVYAFHVSRALVQVHFVFKMCAGLTQVLRGIGGAYSYSTYEGFV